MSAASVAQRRRAKQVQRWLESGKSRDRDEALRAYEPYAHSRAEHYQRCDVPINELRQAAMLGLLHGLESYRVGTRRSNFLTHARYRIDSQIQRYIAEHIPGDDSRLEEAFDLASLKGDPDSVLDDICLRQALGTLPEREREFGDLVFMAGLSESDAAQVAGINPDHVSELLDKVARTALPKLFASAA
jgi:RNA polymerase sigma factor (sigma-70 family)